MGLKEKLLSDMKEAVKSRDKMRLATIRLLVAEIKNKEIDLRKDLSDEEVADLIPGQIKKRKEAAALYEKGGRMDLCENEQKEMAILEDYLPEQVSEEELRSRIQEVIESSDAQGPKDIGKVMKTVIPEFKGKADGGLIKNIVTELLGKTGSSAN